MSLTPRVHVNLFTAIIFITLNLKYDHTCILAFGMPTFKGQSAVNVVIIMETTTTKAKGASTKLMTYRKLRLSAKFKE